MKTQEKCALITGGSQGLGKEIAIALAKRKINILLVSLPGEGLAETAKEIERLYNVSVKYFEIDLTRLDSVYQIAAWAKANAKISILINNAGIGGSKCFEDASVKYIENIIMLNIRATSLLTRLLINELKEAEEAFILNVASMASFSPIAYKTVYPASKAFIYSFSRGLYEELRGTSVFVSVLHPGPIKTNPEVCRRISQQGFLGKMGLITTEKLAELAVKQLFKRDSLIIPGFVNKMNWLLIKIVPIWIRLPLVSNVVKKELLIVKN
jgi:short-subunit dehydrogenase